LQYYINIPVMPENDRNM